MLENYLKVALRNFIKHKIYSSINVLGLAMGMACCIFILLWIQDELGYDRFHKNADNLYRVIVKFPNNPVETTSETSPWAIGPLLKRTYPEVIKATRLVNRTYLTKYKNNHYYEKCLLVDADFLEMFTFPFIKGNPQKAFPDRNSVVISERLAKKFFKNDDPIGKMLKINNWLNLAVTGVIKNVPANSHLQFDFLAPVQILGEETINSWAFANYSYILLQKNAPPDDLRKKIANTIMEHDDRTTIKTVVDLQPFTRIHLYLLNEQEVSPIVYIYIFFCIALIVLFIACINFTNLSTARFSFRTKEVGLRKVLGAIRPHLIKQFLIESMLMSSIAMIFAIVLVLLLLPEFNSLASKQLSLDFSSNIWHLLTLILIVMITGIIAGSYTALFLSSFQPINVIKGTGTPGSMQYILRKFLVISQFASAGVLIICTAIIYSQINYFHNKELGFDKDNIVSIPMNGQLHQKYDTIKHELLQNQNILNVTSSTSMPFYLMNYNPVHWEGKSPGRDIGFNFASVDYDYFETFKMKMVKGRSFSREFPTDKQNYIVNENAVKFMEMKDPIGKQFSIWEDKGKIIGVVKDFHLFSLHRKIEPAVFTLSPNWKHLHMFIKIKTHDITSTLGYLGNLIPKFTPDFPYEYHFVDDTYSNEYGREKQIGNMFKYFTFLAIFISCMGLYGLTSYMAEQKTREIGIRKVFGASVSTIVLSLSKKFVKWILIANIISWPVAYLVMNKWLQGFAYHTKIYIWIFFISTLISLIITVLTVSYQSFKAAKVNPVDSLRYE